MASIEKRATKSGPRWRVVWWEDGVRQQQTYRIEEAAVKFRQRVEGNNNRWPPGEDPRVKQPSGGLTFGDWARRAIDMRTRASERTKDDYRRFLRTYLEPLTDLPLRAIDAEVAARWITQLRTIGDSGERAPLSPKSIRNLHGFASSIMADALAQHPPLVEHNPFARRLSDTGDVHTEDMTFLTPQEFALVLGYVRDEYRDLIRFLAGTGLRFGEATALQVRDIDLLGDRKTVTVTKAWKRTASASWVIGEPKTRRSRRTIGISSELVDTLVPLVASRRGDELLFAGPHGLRIPHIDVYKRGWAPAVARARVCDEHYGSQRDGRGNPPRLPRPCDCPGTLDKIPRIHDLRHSHVSWLIADGNSLPAISRRVGHSSITITIDRYGHLDPSLDERINETTDRALALR